MILEYLVLILIVSYLVRKLEINGGLSLSDRMSLAAEAFTLTYNYDKIISNWFENYLNPDQKNWSTDKIISEKKLRYGENPHQSGALQINSKSGLGSIEQLQGKELSYNNINDIDAALPVSYTHLTLPTKRKV